SQEEMSWDEVLDVEQSLKYPGEDIWHLERKVAKSRLLVDEVEIMGEPSTVPTVRYRSETPLGDRYRHLVIQLPPPCIGRGGYRDTDKDRGHRGTDEDKLTDIGRMGSKRWKKSLKRLLRKLLQLLDRSGEAFVVVPMFMVGSAEHFDPMDVVRSIIESADHRVDEYHNVTQDESS